MRTRGGDGTRRVAGSVMRRGRVHPGAVTALCLAVLLAVVAACGPGSAPTGSAVSPVTEAEARSMTEGMLTAFNAGDYAAWSRDWSETMKNAIPEQTFREFRQQTLAQAGMYQAIESISSRPGQQPGATRWESMVQFSKGRYIFMIAFKEGSKRIEGVNLSPAS